jgi:hypothetical protein
MKVHPVTSTTDEVNTRAKRNFLLAGIVLLIVATPLAFFMAETFYIKKHEVSIRAMLEARLPQGEVLNLRINRLLNSYHVKCTVINNMVLPLKEKELLNKNIIELFDKSAEVQLIILPAQY